MSCTKHPILIALKDLAHDFEQLELLAAELSKVAGMNAADEALEILSLAQEARREFAAAADALWTYAKPVALNVVQK